MTRILLVTLVLLVVIVSSCQREYTFEEIDNPIPEDSTQTADPDSISSDYGGLLVKVNSYETIDGVLDSTATNYRYDTESRLVELNSYAKIFTNPAVEDYKILLKIERASNGLIKEVKLVTRLFYTPDDNQPHYDVMYEFYHDENPARYKYAIMSGMTEGEFERDSIVFEYNNAGQLVKKTTHGYNSMDIPTKHILHIYYDNKGNIIRHNKFFEYEGNTSESHDNTYTYDDKKIPTDFGTLSLLLFDDIQYLLPTGQNNAVSGVDELDRYVFPKNSYSYNSFDKPAILSHLYDVNDNWKHVFLYKK